MQARGLEDAKIAAEYAWRRMEICSSQGILDAMIIAEVSDSDTAKDDKGDLMMRHSCHGILVKLRLEPGESLKTGLPGRR